MRPSSVSISTVPPALAVTARSTASAVSTDTIAAMICLPSKASSMRIESSARAHHRSGRRARRRDGRTRLSGRTAAAHGGRSALLRSARLVEGRTDVVDLVGDVVHPDPRFARNRPTGVSFPVGASSSTRLSPTSTGGGLDALVADRVEGDTGEAPKRRKYVETAASRSVTANPRWWTPRTVTPRPYSDACAAERVDEPYSTASARASANRSRSMSSSTCSRVRPAWRAMISAICRVVDSTSRAATVTSSARRGPLSPADHELCVREREALARRSGGHDHRRRRHAHLEADVETPG